MHDDAFFSPCPVPQKQQLFQELYRLNRQRQIYENVCNWKKEHEQLQQEQSERMPKIRSMCGHELDDDTFTPRVRDLLHFPCPPYLFLQASWSPLRSPSPLGGHSPTSQQPCSSRHRFPFGLLRLAEIPQRPLPVPGALCPKCCTSRPGARVVELLRLVTEVVGSPKWTGCAAHRDSRAVPHGQKNPEAVA